MTRLQIDSAVARAEQRLVAGLTSGYLKPIQEDSLDTQITRCERQLAALRRERDRLRKASQ